MAVDTTAGSTLHISAAAPATFDAAGYAALSWSAVGEITDLGDFGRVYELVKHNPVASRGTVKKKGTFDEGSMALQLGLDNNDAGQTIMKAAVNSDADYSIKVTLQGGDVYYFQALVMDFKIGAGSGNQVTSATSNLEITTNSAGVGIVEVLA